MAALELTGALPVGIITIVINSKESAATRLWALTNIVPWRLSNNIQPRYWHWCRCVVPNDERTRLQEHIVEISGCSSMEDSVSASESGISVETGLALPLPRSGEAEGGVDGPDWGLDIYWWNVGNVSQTFSEK